MYAVKVFNGDLTYKDTINPRDIVWDFRFSANINSSMWPITIAINKPFADNTYRGWDIVKVFAITEDNKAWSLAYGGVVTKVRRKADNTKEIIELDCLWYSQLMNFTAVEWILTNNRPPQDLVSDLIDFLNTKYPWYFYIDSIDMWQNISYWISSFSTALQHLERIAEITWWSWFIWPDGGLKMWNKPNTSTHKLTYRKDVSEVEVEEDSTGIVNVAYITWATASSSFPWPQNFFVQKVEDLPSIAQYWERVAWIRWETRDGKATRVKEDNQWNPVLDPNWNPVLEELATTVFYWPIWQQSAIDFWNSQLKTEPAKTTRVKVNNKYNYFSITPFDTIRVLNKEYQIVNLQVLKVTYSKWFAMLELENIQNLWTLWKRLLG